MLSFCSVPESRVCPGGELYMWRVPWFLHLAAQVLQLPCIGHNLTAWLWWPEGLTFLGPIGLWFLADCHPQGTLQTVRWGIPPSLSMKGGSWLVQDLWPEDRLHVWHIFVDCGTSLKKHSLWTLSWALPLPSSSSLVSPRKELPHIQSLWVLWLPLKGHCQISRPIEVTLAVP